MFIRWATQIYEFVRFLGQTSVHIREVSKSIRFNKKIFTDKIYRSSDYWEQQKCDKANEFYAPVKFIKGAADEERQRSKAADDLYSQAVSAVREPIEALFCWLNEKANIQRASKCRSTCGLLIHTMGKVAIAFYTLFSTTDSNK